MRFSIHKEGGRPVICRHNAFSACVLILLGPAVCSAGWPFSSDGGPKRHSEEYYQMRAGEPIGQRQQYKYGKVWPPVPRVGGEPTPFIHRFYANHYWPHPYSQMDQNSVFAVEQTQIANGWLSATTFYDYHFDAETNSLNSAGLSHLRWLMVHVPQQYRRVNVAMTGAASANDVRVANIEDTLAKMVGDAGAIPVVLRVSTPTGRSASEIQSIFEQRMENMDTPVIPYSAGSASGGGG